MSKKIILTIISTIMLIIMTISCVQADTLLSGLNGVQTIVGMGASTVTDGETKISLSLNDMANVNNHWLYCISYHNENSVANKPYKVLTYIEIEDGIAKVWDVNGNNGNASNYHEENKILAEILSGNYGDIGYGSSTGSYTNTQKGLYAYWDDWIRAVGKEVGTDSSWLSGDGFSGGGDIVAKAEQAVANGANPSAKIYLLNEWTGQGESWQRLLIAESTSNEKGKLVIKKVGNKDVKLKAVSFKIRTTDGSYLVTSSPNSKNQYTVTGFTSSASSATTFTTGTSSYKDITVLGVPRGKYIIEETANPNKGYEANVGKQELVMIDTNGSASITIKNRKDEDYDGYIIIKGKVWLDKLDGKSNTLDGICSDKESGLAGIQVTLKASNGESFKGQVSTTTNSNGEYTLKVNYNDKNKPYQIEENFDAVHNRLMNYGYVEFTYDGVKYTTVAPYNSGANTSKAIESESGRNSLDGTKSKYRITPSTGTLSGNVTASTQNVIKFSNYSDVTYDTQKRYDKWCTAQGGDQVKYIYTDPDDNSIVHESTCGKHLMVEGYDYTYYKTVLVDEITGETEHVYCGHTHDNNTGCRGYDHTSSIRDTSEDEYCNDPGHGEHDLHTITIDRMIINNVNLGLFEREMPNIALTSDIEEVKVTMNNQQYRYLYKNKGNPQYDGDAFATVKFQNKYTYTYKREVNPADVAYIQDKSENILNVTVKYKVTVANKSNTLRVTVNKLMSSFDPEYDKILSDNWGEATDKENGKFKEAISKDLSIDLNPKETKSTYVEYNVSQKAIKELINQNATLNNVFEIHTYTTKYGDDTLCAEQKYGNTWGRTNKTYAGRELISDSSPGNADVWYNSKAEIKDKNGKVTGKEPRLDIKKGEDDTDIAPSFVLCLDEYKVLSGTVYEDTQTTESAKNKERLGNGVKDSNEIGIKNVKVELLKTDEKGNILKDKNGNVIVADLYYIDQSKAAGKKVIASKAVTYTDAEGNYSFGKTGEVGKKNAIGVVVDNYIIRFTYGDNNIDGKGGATTLKDMPINARNFKSTIVTQNPIKGVMTNDSSISKAEAKKWHLTTADNTTVAVDDLDLRKQLTDEVSLINKNFNDKINMSAYSEPFSLQVEYTELQKANVKANGDLATGQFAHIWTTFDFGIIERAREDFVVDKTIEKLKITLGNGQVLIEGNPYRDKMNYVKALGTEDVYTRNDSLTGKEKLLYIEMDQELIQGARIDLIYKITVTNNSEKDYQYDNKNVGYYYYGNNSGLELINNTIEYVADYMDSELTCTVGENATSDYNKKGWEQVSAEKLFDEGKISETVKNQLEEAQYSIFITDSFKNLSCYDNPKTEEKENQKSKYLFASKLLANSAEDYTYENHAEIIQINGKVARTIDSVNDNRKQVSKTYIPGDYIPSTKTRSINEETVLTSLHQPDDDRIILRITPPTGLVNNIIIYIVTGLVGLIILIAGTYVIKKKVLGK